MRPVLRPPPGVPLKPTQPQKLAGRRIEPTTCVPSRGDHARGNVGSGTAARSAWSAPIGKVVTTEFAGTEPRGTRNPWDNDGSSGLGRLKQRRRRECASDRQTGARHAGPNAGLKTARRRAFVNRDMTQPLVAPALDFGGTPSMCVVVSNRGETDGHHYFKLHGAQECQARR